jgi:uncharacterized protein involved in type VI secretion and phage assembly
VVADGSVTRFYLSADQERGAGDRRMAGGRSVPELAAGASFTGNRVVTVPANMVPGEYYVLGCADDTGLVAESEEANNCRSSSSPVTVVPPLPDLVVSMITDPPVSAEQGATFAVGSTTANVGAVVADGSVTRFYLSADQERGAGDRRMAGGRSVPELAAGASFTGNRVVTVPANMVPGEYYVLGCADDTGLVAESEEANNCRSSATRMVVVAS